MSVSLRPRRMSSRRSRSMWFCEIWRPSAALGTQTVITSPESLAYEEFENQRRYSSGSMSILMRSSSCDQTLTSDISFVVRVVLVRLARGEIVHIRHTLVRRIVVERERTSGVLERDRSAWTLGFFFLGLRVRTTLWLGVGSEVAGAAWRRRCERIERSRRAAEAATAAGARAAESSRART